MVQTRSKCRLLQNNPTAVDSEKSTQLPSSTSQPSKRKRKRKDDNNDEDITIITSNTITTNSFIIQSTFDSVVTQSMATSSISIPSHTQKKSDTVKRCMNQSLQTPSSHLPDLSIVLSLEAVDGAPDNDAKEDEHLGTSIFLLNSSDSEDENFDTNLHSQQQILIEALNREASDEDILPPDDINADATASITTLHQSPNSWPIEKNDLHWTKTNKGSDCLVMGNFSYIYMSESQKKNVLNLRCQRRDIKCGAVIHLDLHTRSFIDTNNVNHNHPPNEFAMKQKILNQKINDRIAVEPTAVLKVVERVYAEANLTDEEQLNIRLPKAVGRY
jgi:hypothetical protein